MLTFASSSPSVFRAVRPLALAILRQLSSEDFLSGEALAQRFGVSRASIWGALREVEAHGVQVFKVRGRGYRLAEAIEWLDAEAVRAHAGSANSLVLEVADVVESTSTRLMKRADEPALHRHCLVAEVQTAGRGRRGRHWLATPGGSLTFSLLWRFNLPAAGLSGLSLAVGLALARGLHELGMPDVQLKWPNDLVQGYRKLGGVLIELQGEVQGPTAAVIGVGVNVRMPEPMRLAIDQAVTDLAGSDAGQSRNRLLGRLLHHLTEVLERFEQAGFAPLRPEWEALHAYHERPVTILLPGGKQEQGTVRGVADDGLLRVETGRGVQTFGSGEISLRIERGVR